MPPRHESKRYASKRVVTWSKHKVAKRVVMGSKHNLAKHQTFQRQVPTHLTTNHQVPRRNDWKRYIAKQVT